MENNDEEPSQQPSNQGAINVDLHWQTGIQALKVEVEVKGEVQPSSNGVQWRGNGVQAKLRKKGCEGWWRVLWDTLVEKTHSTAGISSRLKGKGN